MVLCLHENIFNRSSTLYFCLQCCNLHTSIVNTVLVKMDKLSCSRCGISNFSTIAGLFSHQRNRCQGRQVVVGSSTLKPIVPNLIVGEGDLDGVSMCSGERSMRHGLSVCMPEGCNLEGSTLNPDMWEMPSMAKRNKNVPLLPFDSTFHVVNFVRNCKNEQGLSRQDIQALLDLLLDNRFDPKTLTVRNPDDIEKYEEKELYPSSDVCCLT